VNLYENRNSSAAQKWFIFVAELVFLILSWLALFWRGGGDGGRRALLFVFNLVTFARFLVTLGVTLKRQVGWEEAISVGVAFGLYYLGFALLGRGSGAPLSFIDLVAILIFLGGGSLNTFSELARKGWKSRSENAGKLYVHGAFSLCRHPNYLGDLLWVGAYALVTRNPWSSLVPAFLFVFFYFYNAPLLDKHLAAKYGDEYAAWAARVKSIIPFVL